jgi:hypothetical protein
MTRNGLQVRLYARDGGGEFPVHGAVLIGKIWHPQHWTARGRAFLGGESELDLVPYGWSAEYAGFCAFLSARG